MGGTILHYVVAGTMRTARPLAYATFDDGNRRRQALARLHLCQNLLPLRMRQLPQRFQ